MQAAYFYEDFKKSQIDVEMWRTEFKLGKAIQLGTKSFYFGGVLGMEKQSQDSCSCIITNGTNCI